MLSSTVLPGTTWQRPRSRLVAVALWLAFGTFGIHRAYLNRRYWLGIFLAGFIGWGSALLSWSMYLIGHVEGLALVYGFGLLLLFLVGCLWIIDLFRLSGWVADHNIIIGRRPL